MGKVGAYIDFGRVAHGERPAAETLKDFGEFAVPLDEKDSDRALVTSSLRAVTIMAHLDLSMPSTTKSTVFEPTK